GEVSSERYFSRGNAQPSMDTIEIDDVIPKPYQDQIEAELKSSTMPWFFMKESAFRTEVETSFSGFSHTAFHFRDPNRNSPILAALLLPVLYSFCERAKIPFTSLLRIRIGLFPKMMIDVPHHNPHVDFYMPHRSAVYYVNESDGDTVLFNETIDQVSEAL